MSKCSRAGLLSALSAVLVAALLLIGLPAAAAVADDGAPATSTVPAATTPAASGTSATADDVRNAVPQVPTGPRWRTSFKVNWDNVVLRAFQNETEVLYARVSANRSYYADVKLPLDVNGRTVLITGRLSGTDIFRPAAVTGLAGEITGEIPLTDGVTITGGRITWDAKGFHVDGTARIACREGAVIGAVTGDYVDADTWSLRVSGGVAAGGCTVSDDLALPSGDLTGAITKTRGAVDGLFEVGGKLESAVLPASAQTWDARLRFFYRGEGAAIDHRVEFFASSGIGTAQGGINRDGTFALNAAFRIPAGDGATVAVAGDIRRDTPGGDVVYDVGGSGDIALGPKASLGGRVRLTATHLDLEGDVRVACPIAGDVTGSLAGSVALDSRDWKLAIGGATGAGGCQVTKELALGPNSRAAGALESVGGKVGVTLEANATVATTLVPTKRSFDVAFTLRAGAGTYEVTALGATEGASFSAEAQSDGTFSLAFGLDDLALGGTSLGARGTIARRTPDGKVSYTIAGGLAGQVKVYDNLYLRGGSLAINDEGELTYRGTVRQICTTGHLDASASGRIRDSRNWVFSARGVASSCVIGQAAKLEHQAFFADIDSRDGVVTYNAGGRIARLAFCPFSLLGVDQVQTSLSNATAAITNTCPGCREANKLRITFETRAHATYTVPLVKEVRTLVHRVIWKPIRFFARFFSWVKWIPITEWVEHVHHVTEPKGASGAVTVFGKVDFYDESRVARVSLGTRDPQLGGLKLPVSGTVSARISQQVLAAITTGDGGKVCLRS